MQKPQSAFSRLPVCHQLQLVVNMILPDYGKYSSRLQPGFPGEFVQFLGYSTGSLNETQTHLCAAYDRKYISKQNFGELFQEGTEIRKMMIAFVQSMVMKGSGVKDKRRYARWPKRCGKLRKPAGKPDPKYWVQKLQTTDCNCIRGFTKPQN